MFYCRKNAQTSSRYIGKSLKRMNNKSQRSNQTFQSQVCTYCKVRIFVVVSTDGNKFSMGLIYLGILYDDESDGFYFLDSIF